MTQLKKLHRRLAALRRRRAAARWASAWSALLTTVLWSLLAVFAVDLLFDLDVTQRLVVFALGVIAIGWSFRRFTLPLLGVRESEIQLALMVENRHGIHSDLVAAIQFERPQAAVWGSRQLEQAVIETAATTSKQLDVSTGSTNRPMRRRLAVALLTIAGVGSLASLFPDHARVFVRRLCLAGDHYPSATIIEAVAVNDRTVLQRESGNTSPADVACAESRPVTFSVRGRGRLPQSGVARLESDGGQQRVLDLDLQSTETGDAYIGRLGRLVEPFSYQLYLGDAWTDSARVEMLPLPVVELQLTTTSPSYSRAAEPENVDPSSRQIAVLEGSAVDVAIRCSNDKQLTDAWVTVDSGDETTRYPLTAEDESGQQWRLATQGTPFAQITEEVRFELQVRDQDEMGLETPIRGQIRLRTDRPPICSADVVHRVVLPTATPIVEYQVNDDYGIAELALHVDVERDRADGDSDKGGQCTLSLLSSSLPLAANRLPLEGQFPLNLASLQLDDTQGPRPAELVKGDRLRVIIEATDFRGDSPGESYRGDPLILEVSDESGVLTAISEADERSEERLTDIIKQQLGIGGE